MDFTFLGYKLSVWIGAALSALLRVLRIRSSAQTFVGKSVDMFTVFFLSIFLALVLLQPVMTLFAISVAYETLTAMILALVAELFFTKILMFAKDFDIKGYLSRFIENKTGK